MAIRVILADDHPATRAGIRGALGQSADIMVVGEAGDGNEALGLTATLQPDVLLLDCRLPGLDGTEVAAAVRFRGYSTRVLPVSAYDDDHCVFGMLEAGTAGYLLKTETLDTIVAAVHAVARGEVWYSQTVVAKVVAWARGDMPVTADPAELTGRELEVLRLLAYGWENQRIAVELVLSEGTVKNHISRIYEKLNVHSRAMAVAWAWRHGMMGEEWR